jgi:hypothetical protein
MPTDPSLRRLVRVRQRQKRTVGSRQSHSVTDGADEVVAPIAAAHFQARSGCESSS